MVVRSRDAGFAPQPDAAVEVPVEGEGDPVVLTGRTNADGEVVLPWSALRSGTHHLDAEVRIGQRVVGRAASVVAVTERDPELDEVAPDPRFLEWWTSQLGGQLFGPGELGPVLLDPDAGHVVEERRETALWRSPALALWTLLFAGAAWWVRRRAGLR